VEYRHAPRADHTALSPGAVLVSAPGHPAFPVRLGLELLGRCLDHLAPAGPVTVWDPCCGSGALLTAMALGWRDRLRAVAASDVDPEPLALARRNLALLSAEGLAERATELSRLEQLHGKESHRAAAQAAAGLAAGLASKGGDLPAVVEPVDALDPAACATFARRVRPDVVITDVPYGEQTQWTTTHGTAGSPDALVASLASALDPHAVIAVVAQDRKVRLSDGTGVLERFRSGHRAGVIVRAGARQPSGR